MLASSQFGGTFLLGALMSPIGWVTPTLGSLALFAAAGVISVIALLCINRSLKLAPASVVVPYQYSMIVWAVMFGYAVFGDVPSIATIVGAAIIIGAGLYIFLRERDSGARRRWSIRRCELRRHRVSAQRGRSSFPSADEVGHTRRLLGPRFAGDE